MFKKWFITFRFYALICATLIPNAFSNDQPNIIFMLADDLGYGDLSCYNPDTKGESPNATPIKTPHLDQMAKNGVRFTDFHSAAPICSPSRRALLTARYPSRLGEWAEAYRGSPDGLVASKEPTISMWLKQAGYDTACYGKWNVGEINQVSCPSSHGFDDWLIIDHNTGYFEHQNQNKNCEGREMLFKNGYERVTHLKGQYLTDIWIDKAIHFVEEKRDKPFFIYLPFAVPHTPLQDPHKGPVAFDTQPKKGTPEARDAFVKMVEYLDTSIGRLFESLKKRGVMDNTLIVFTSDNGGNMSSNNWPLKNKKQYLEEGGIRVPMLMMWKDHIPANSVNHQTSIMMDTSLTLLEAANASQHIPSDRDLDAIDLMPSIQKGSSEYEERTLGWRRRDWAPHFNILRDEAFRQGDWKYIRTYKPAKGKNTRSHLYKDEIYHLKKDIGETQGLKKTMPEKYQELKKGFEKWKKDTVNLNSDYNIPKPDQVYKK